MTDHPAAEQLDPAEETPLTLTEPTALIPRSEAGWAEMRDAANPADLASWDGPVCGYPNHIPPWHPADFKPHFPAGVMRTSVRSDPVWAHACREIDVEKYSAQPWHVPAFILLRLHLGHPHGGVYVSYSRWPQVRYHLEQHRIRPAQVRVRIALWNGIPSPDLNLGGGFTLWAHQFESTETYDRNAIFGETDWSHG